MRKFVALMVLVSAVGAALAAPPKPAPPKPVTCPACHMALSTKKTKDTPIAVRVKKGGPILYCCAGCLKKMPASMVVKGK